MWAALVSFNTVLSINVQIFLALANKSYVQFAQIILEAALEMNES